jgi:hypothetical protein
VDGSGDGFGRSEVLPAHLGNILPFDKMPKITHDFDEEGTSAFFKQFFTNNIIDSIV